MNNQDIKKLVENKDIPDNDILTILKEYLADKYDEEGERIFPDTNEDYLLAMEDLSMFTRRLRPNVMEQLRQEFIRGHGENCPACQNMKQNKEDDKKT